MSNIYYHPFKDDPASEVQENDLLFASDRGNTPYLWRDGKWISVQDAFISSAHALAQVAYASSKEKTK